MNAEFINVNGNLLQYDEHVPDEMDTDHGGFYINSGPLQFKKLANFERPEDAQRMPKPRKVILLSSAQSLSLSFIYSLIFSLYSEPYQAPAATQTSRIEPMRRQKMLEMVNRIKS